MDDEDLSQVLCARYLGRAVSVDDPAGGPDPRRLVGTVEAARWGGRHPRGDFPIVLLTIRGKSGATLCCNTADHYPMIREDE